MKPALLSLILGFLLLTGCTATRGVSLGSVADRDSIRPDAGLPSDADAEVPSPDDDDGDDEGPRHDDDGPGHDDDDFLDGGLDLDDL